MKKIVWLLPLFVLLASSCSVKEDRGVCPCWLRLDLHPCLDVTGDVMVSAWSGNGDSRYLRDKAHVLDYKEYYEADVPKGETFINVFTEALDNIEEGHRITIPFGQDFDRIHAYSNHVVCDGEFYVDTVRLHKQYAVVFVKVEKSELEDYPYEFFVESDVCGIDLLTLSPISGEFRYDIVFDDKDVGSFVLPRQFVDSDALTLNIRNKGVVVESINLAAMVRTMEYSWEDESLEDIYIGVDYADAEVSISISDWGEGQKVDVIL